MRVLSDVDVTGDGEELLFKLLVHFLQIHSSYCFLFDGNIQFPFQIRFQSRCFKARTASGPMMATRDRRGITGREGIDTEARLLWYSESLTEQ